MGKTFIKYPRRDPEQTALRLEFLLYRVLGMNAAELAREFDFLNESTVRGWLNRVHGGLTQQGAIKIIEVAKTFNINVSLEWLLYGIEPGPTAEDILTVFKSQSQSTHVNVTEKTKSLTPEEKIIINELKLFADYYPKYLSYKVIDDGLLHYNPGDIVAGVIEANNFTEFLGKDCIIEATDKQLYFRHFHQQNEDGTYNLRCTNPNANVKPYELCNIEVAKLAEIIWHRRKYSAK